MRQFNVPKEFLLFLDESGKFKETSTDLAEMESIQKERKIKSQLVGFLAVRQSDINQQARKILLECYQAAGIEFGRKGSKLKRFELNLIIPHLINKMKQKGWQPVRLVNKEKMTYGPRVSTYTSMVAELLLRIFQEKSQPPQERVSISLTGARVTLDDEDQDDLLISIPAEEGGRWRKIRELSYKRRIEEALGGIAVRQGQTRNQLNWKLRDLKLKDARIEPELQICDLLSNATYDTDEQDENNQKYFKSTPENRVLLEQAFGIYDQTMETSQIIQQVQRLINDQALSSALIILTEALCDNQETAYFKKIATKQLKYIIDRLVQIGARGRDAHLAVLIAWLDQMIGQRWSIEKGYNTAKWLQERFARALQDKLKNENKENSLAWFVFSLYRWVLTAANHHGALRHAQLASEKMASLHPLLAQQSENIGLLIEGIIVQAVHQMDCFNFAKASEQMERIADLPMLRVQGLTELIRQPSDLTLRSDIRAKALGTLTLTLTLAGFRNEADVRHARSRSDEAIEEFTGSDDKERQYQYRCHLETVARDFTKARCFLMKSLRPTGNDSDVSHELLWEAICLLEKEQTFKYSFTLAHWLRVGAMSARKNDLNEASEFNAFCQVFDSLLPERYYLNKNILKEFPLHLILKSIAIIEAARGRVKPAIKALCRLDEAIGDNEKHLILMAIQVAGYAEVAAHLWGREESFRLLGLTEKSLTAENKPKDGIKQILTRMQGNQLKLFPVFNAKVQSWQQKINDIDSKRTKSNENRALLFGIADEVLY